MAERDALQTASSARRDAVRRRLLDATREVGVLLVAFTPLDYIMQRGTARPAAVAILFAAGAALFTVSVLLETRIRR